MTARTPEQRIQQERWQAIPMRINGPWLVLFEMENSLDDGRWRGADVWRARETREKREEGRGSIRAWDGASAKNYHVSKWKLKICFNYNLKSNQSTTTFGDHNHNTTISSYYLARLLLTTVHCIFAFLLTKTLRLL